MKILILSQYFYPEIGATQIRMYEFARFLASKGHQVTVVCELPNHPTGRIPREYRGRLFDEEVRDGFRIVRVWVWASPEKNLFNRLLFYISFLVFSIIRSLTLERPDVVLATSPPLFTGLAGWIVSAFKRAHFVLDIRDVWPAAAVALGVLRKGVALKAAEWLERFLYRRSDLITVVTRGFCDYLNDIHAIPQTRVKWIPNGTVSHIFRPFESTELRRLPGFNDKFIVAFAGNLGLAQGLDIVIEAARRINDQDAIAFVLIGAGPCREGLEEQARLHQLSCVRFLDQVPAAQVVGLLNSADALLAPLRDSSHWVFQTFLPVKMFDYMACGKPVLLGANGEALEILRESGGGLHFHPGKPLELLSAIRYLQGNPEEGEEMGRRGRAYVLRHFNRQLSSERLEASLRHLLGAGDGTNPS